MCDRLPVGVDEMAEQIADRAGLSQRVRVSFIAKTVFDDQRTGHVADGNHRQIGVSRSVVGFADCCLRQNDVARRFAVGKDGAAK
ncbi:MAG: hypothetical protein PF501_05155 [Salinisphaera sp.]|jgi:hypothetical protein|nr:hypothetical protein [Salinisphaera sp.]